MMVTNIPKVRTDRKSQIKEANNNSKLHQGLYSKFRKPKTEKFSKEIRK